MQSMPTDSMPTRQTVSYLILCQLAVALSTLTGASTSAGAEAGRNLPPDPYDALKLQNDMLGVRVWGPATKPTLSVGRSDIWDRRWFAQRQPLITMARIRELAMANRLVEVARTSNDGTTYPLYCKYDFPCPKPGAQLVLGTPFATSVRMVPEDRQGVRLLIEGNGKRLAAHVWVAVARPLVVVEFEAEGLAPQDLWLRVYRHRDTIVPGEPTSPTLGGRPSARDFQQMTPPLAHQADDKWGIIQEFSAESTFPDGFLVAAVATAIGAEPSIECRQDEKGLGTPLWAQREGRFGHGVTKRYTPINEAVGAAATATFGELPRSFAVVFTIATTQDGPDPRRVATEALDQVRTLGLEGLHREQSEALRRGQRKLIARALVDGQTQLAAPAVVLPSLRRPNGYYGDVPLCSVGSTKFCFQDAGLWHSDFHLNEIRAENMVTLGQFEEMLPYCRMIHTLLPQARQNAHDVYDLPGAMYPLVHFPLRCRSVTYTSLTWEQDMGLNGLVSKPLWLYYRYTGDKDFLRDVGYPVLRECARFMAAYLREEEDGRLHIVPSVSPEHWGLTAGFKRNRDCTSALTLTRYLLRSAAAAAEVLGQDSQEAAAWKVAAERLAPYPTFQTPEGPVWVDVLGAPPIEYNIPVPLTPVFWGDHVGLDSSAETIALAKRTLDQIRVWNPHRGYLNSCVHPRLGILRSGAGLGPDNVLLTHHLGITQPGGGLGPENFLLSYQSIHIFPALPADAEIVMENFAAEGGFRVCAKRTTKQEVRDVRIRSNLGQPCRLANPWHGRAVRVTTADGAQVVQTQGPQSHVTFDTRPGETYVVEPL